MTYKFFGENNYMWRRTSCLITLSEFGHVAVRHSGKSDAPHVIVLTEELVGHRSRSRRPERSPRHCAAHSPTASICSLVSSRIVPNFPYIWSLRYMKCAIQPVSFSADTIRSSGNRSNTFAEDEARERALHLIDRCIVPISILTPPNTIGAALFVLSRGSCRDLALLVAAA